MATASPTLGERRFLIRGIGWDGYELLLDAFGDDGPRMNYLRGDVELMSPSIPHEQPSFLLAYLVVALCDELDIPSNALASTTLRRAGSEVGLEADACFYLRDNAGKHRGMRTLDLDLAPPPDLAIEVEQTNPLLPKLEIYARIGVPEIWRYRRGRFGVLLLQAGGSYTESATSLAFPFLPMLEIDRLLLEYDEAEETRWRRRLRAWVRESILPLYQKFPD